MVPAADAAGLLYVEADCPPEMESEFHAWYNLEHVPERMGISGFVSGRRYAALEGSPRWLASYELKTVDVLESAEYHQWLGGPLQTPWTTRMLASMRTHRSVFRLGERARSAEPCERPLGLLAVRCDALLSEAEPLTRWHDLEFFPALRKVSGVTSAARYENTEGAEQLCLYEMKHPWIMQDAEFLRVWAAGWDARRNRLARYRRTLYIRIL